MDKEKPKSGLMALLALLLALILPACAPHMTYDELHDALEVAVTDEERDKLTERIELYERDAIRADKYFANRESCGRSDRHTWFCKNPVYESHRVDQLLKQAETLDDRVKLYRRLRGSCGCADTRDLMRALGY